ncbi:TM2 domain-containing protein [Cetobacterium sp. SF1]|uniref:TM2 domain-containing protein n=1 Tax=unclassified Cetobacterium TaxID=2630983 RepID=UPI003CED232C
MRDYNVGKDWLITLLLAIFLGPFGVHRFYVGKVGTGILQLITCGGFGIWYLIDIFMILIGSFRDANGNPLVKN